MSFSIPRDIVLTIIGTFFGLLVGWGISHLYYVRNISDMKVESEQRKHTKQLLLRGIESIGTIKYSRNREGQVVGVNIELKAHVAAKSKTSDVTISIDKTK